MIRGATSSRAPNKRELKFDLPYPLDPSRNSTGQALF